MSIAWWHRFSAPTGITVAEIAEAVGVHRTSVYDYLNEERCQDYPCSPS